MNLILTIYGIGIFILVGAIIINIITGFIGIRGWYYFLSGLRKRGIKKMFKQLSVYDYIFMFVVYPLLLGLFGWLGFIVFVNLG